MAYHQGSRGKSSIANDVGNVEASALVGTGEGFRRKDDGGGSIGVPATRAMAKSSIVEGWPG